MPKPKFKKQCGLCRKNMVTIYSHRQYPVCEECEMRQISEEPEDPEMKTFFDIPLELYKKSSFLRSIKRNYLRFGSLSEKQIEAFKKTAKEMQEGKKEESQED